MTISKEENILFAAEKLFAKHGFSGTSTRDICKEAGVNISMISYYFGSKEKLYERIFTYRMDEGRYFATDIAADQTLNEWEKLLAIVNKYAIRIRTLRSFYLIMQREQLSNKNPYILDYIKQSKFTFLKTYKDIVEKGFANNIFTKRPRLELLHATIAGTLFTAINGLPMYQEFSANTEAEFLEQFYIDLDLHLQDILKYLLGYHEK